MVMTARESRDQEAPAQAPDPRRSTSVERVGARRSGPAGPADGNDRRLASGWRTNFNNLLTAILGQCDILLRRLPPEEGARKGIEEIRTAGERAAGLTRQLLAYSRQQVLKPRVIDLNTSVTSMSPCCDV